MDEWNKKMCYTIEYYSVMKKNEILTSATTQMTLEGIMLSDISQTEKDWFNSQVESTKSNEKPK